MPHGCSAEQNCGTIDDGCGAKLDCGMCAYGECGNASGTFHNGCACDLAPTFNYHCTDMPSMPRALACPDMRTTPPSPNCKPSSAAADIASWFCCL